MTKENRILPDEKKSISIYNKKFYQSFKNEGEKGIFKKHTGWYSLNFKRLKRATCFHNQVECMFSLFEIFELRNCLLIYL